jgi:hypothetical protein
MDPIKTLSMATYYIGSMVLGIIALNSRQAYRPILLVGVIICAVLSLRLISDTPLGSWGHQVFATFTIIYISHISCVLCVEKYILPQNLGVHFDWVGGYKMLFNARWIGTNRQVPSIKAPSNRDATINTEIEKVLGSRTLLRSPRAIFLFNRVISVAATLIAERIYNHCSLVLPSYYDAQLELTDFLPTKESFFRRLGEVTLRETVIRGWLVTFFLFYSVCMFNMVHDILAIIFVGTKVDGPEDWPPLFGDIREATSIRNFWGKFSHKLVYRSFTSYGIWISKNILRLPRSSFIGKLFITFFVFTMSGAVHALALWQLGYSCGAWEELRFYVFNFFGVLVETIASPVFFKITRGYKLNHTISNAVGYAWVFMFLFTILPKSQYPKVSCAPSMP